MCLCTGTKHTTKTKAKGTKKDCSYAKIHTIQKYLYQSLSFTKMFAISLKVGHPERTLYCLAGYYIFCGYLNFHYYGRIDAERPGA